MPLHSDHRDKKTRSRTGCVTCRRRHVKCDQARPTCERCTKANVVCAGYVQPKNVLSSSESEEDDEIIAPRSRGRSKPYGNGIRPRNEQASSIALNAVPGQRLHASASATLAFLHYVSRTTAVLFDQSDQWFWRDHVSTIALSNELVFDAVVTLGAAHKAALLPSQTGDDLNGLVLRNTAADFYLRAVDAFQSGNNDDYRRLTADVEVAVLLLLTIYQCFSHDAATTFHLLRGAKIKFALSSSSPLDQSVEEVLRTPIRHLDLVAKSLLPPLITALAPAVSPAARSTHALSENSNACGIKESLLALISRDDFVYVAAWKQFSGWVLADFAKTKIDDFVTDMQQWLRKAEIIVAKWHEPRIFDDTGCKLFDRQETLQQRPIPPTPKYFQSNDLAFAAALYHCYMARAMAMLSIFAHDDKNPIDFSAYVHSYELLRVVTGMIDIHSREQVTDSRYIPSESVILSLAPLLFLTSQHCYNQAWQTWITGTLRLIGTEGLHYGTAYAKAIELLGAVQDRQETAWARNDLLSNAGYSYSPLGHTANRIIPIIFGDTSSSSFTTYYVYAKMPYGERRYIVATAYWTRGTAAGDMQDVSIDYVQPNSRINEDLSDHCVYGFLSRNEPAGVKWQQLFTGETHIEY